MKESVKVLVLGGGYAGIMAALRLAGRVKNKEAKVTLINGSEYFVERPRLPEVAVGTTVKQKPILEMLANSSAQFKQGWVNKIIPDTQAVLLQDGRKLNYDYLIVALGSRVNREMLPGIKEFAFTPDPSGERTTSDLHQFLSTRSGKQRIVVIGGGATGIEMATEVKGAYPNYDVAIMTNDIVGAFKGERVQQHIHSALDSQLIQMLENCQVSKINGDGVFVDDELYPADCIIWSGGFHCSPLTREAGLKVNQQNQILVDPFLRSLTDDNIYAVGDVGFPVEDCGVPVRMALLPALVTGATAAENVYRRIIGQEERPLSFEWYGQAITLGPKDAVGFNTYPKDTPVGPILRKKLALNTRNFFVSFLANMLEFERRWTGAFYWTGRRRYLSAKKRVNIPHDRTV